MTSNKPYYIRALYEWIVDNACTPYLLVDATQKDVHVPKQFVNEGQIILNISPNATDMLLVNNESIDFKACFSGKALEIFVPMSAVLAIYAKENGHGMAFSGDVCLQQGPIFAAGIAITTEKNEDTKLPKKEPNKKPNLTVIK